MNNIQKQSGIALIEALVAALILSLGMLGLARLQTNMVAANESAKQQLKASEFAQDKIEELRAFAELDAGATGGLDFDEIVSCGSVSGCDTITDASTTYVLFWNVIDVLDSSGALVVYKNVHVTVSWVSGKGNNSITQSTIIARNSPATTGMIVKANN